MKRLYGLGLLMLPLILLIGCGTAASSSYAIPETVLQEGDLVFRLGVGVSSRAVRAVDRNGGFSHVGIIVKADSAWHVVHVVNGESEDTHGEEIIKNEPLSQFFRKDRSCAGCILRYDTLAVIRQRIAQAAVRTSLRSIPFDHEYRESDTTKLYCTELIHRLYLTEKIDLTQGVRGRFPLAKEPLILPSHLFRHPRLQLVYKFH